jgi:iron complex transport system permease protein
LDRIEIFSIGEEFAIASGVSPEKLKLEVFVIISIVATVVTATVGIVPFIGIIIPYFVKTLFKGSIYKHFFVVLICGALILLISDFVSLVISSYLRLPVFVLLNLFGFPFFVYLIWKR